MFLCSCFFLFLGSMAWTASLQDSFFLVNRFSIEKTGDTALVFYHRANGSLGMDVYRDRAIFQGSALALVIEINPGLVVTDHPALSLGDHLALSSTNSCGVTVQVGFALIANLGMNMVMGVYRGMITDIDLAVVVCGKYAFIEQESLGLAI